MRVLTRLNRSIERLDGMSRSTQHCKADKHQHPNRRWEDKRPDMQMSERSTIEKAMDAENSPSKEALICVK